MKILFVGWFIRNRNGDGIVRAFEQLGHTVYKIAMDSQVKEKLSPHNLHLRSYIGDKRFVECIRRNTLVNISEILKLFPDSDMVYIYQTSVGVNTENIDIPVVYYHHEVLLPKIPFGRIDLIFYNYHGCIEQLDKIYRDRLRGIKFIRSTFGMEIDRYKFYEGDRPIFMGFKGAINAYNPNNDPVMEGIYLNRRKYIQYAKDNCECQFEGYSINPDAMDQLIYFLQHCNISLNIPGCIGNWGFNNERMYLAMSIGCVLLQFRYPKIEDDKLIDYENCLLFSNEKELQEKYEWAKSNIDKLDTIRKNGYNTVREHFNHKKCVKKMINDIKKYCCFESTNKVPLFKTIIPKKRLQILLIGDNTKFSITTQYYYNELCKKYDVTWIGDDAKHLNTEYFSKTNEKISGLMGTVNVNYQYLKLSTILNIFDNKKFDLIIHFQNQIQFTEDKPSKIPYIYIVKQLWNFKIPESSSLVLTSNFSGIEQIKYYYKNKFPIIYFPFPLNVEFENLIIDKHKRIYDSSFSGELYHPYEMLSERRKIIKYCKNNISFNAMNGYTYIFGWFKKEINKDGSREIESGPGRLGKRSYKEVLLRSKYGLNCPTTSGFNFRDLEIMGAGAVLITKHSEDLKFLGFKNGVHCYFYNTKEEALNLLLMEYTDKQKKIAKNGYNLVNTLTYNRSCKYLEKIFLELLKNE